jgi:hypothetical protein
MSYKKLLDAYDELVDIIKEEDNVFCKRVMDQVSKIAALKNKELSKPDKQLAKYASKQRTLALLCL